MKKRFLVLPLIAALALSMAACGGSSEEETEAAVAEAEGEETEEEAEEEAEEEETEEEAEEAEEDSEIPEERSEDALSTLAVGYAGVGDDGYCYYLASDENVEYMAFVMLDADNAQSMNAVGTATVNDDLTFTIDDTYSGYSVTFAFERTEGGAIITLKDGTQVALADVDPAEVADMIRAIDENTEIVNPLADEAAGGEEAAEEEEVVEEEVVEEEAAVDYASQLTEAYVGQSESGALVIYLANEDGSVSVLAYVNPDETFAATYVGSVTNDADNLCTFVDDATGDSTQVYMIPSTDDAGNFCILFTQDGESGFQLYENDVETAINDLHAAGLEF